ncbi:hypothetical protein [Altericroceibacterium spongiae]|nr:hypothetical protein [Altericroceibacterium spongiae]
MLERKCFRPDEEALAGEEGDPLRPLSWHFLLERFARARALRHWYLAEEENENFCPLSPKNNSLPQEQESKFAINSDALGNGKSNRGVSAAHLKRNSPTTEEKHD